MDWLEVFLTGADTVQCNFKAGKLHGFLTQFPSWKKHQLDTTCGGGGILAVAVGSSVNV